MTAKETTSIMQIIVSNTSISTVQYNRIKNEIEKVDCKKDKIIGDLIEVLETIIKYQSDAVNTAGVELTNTLPFQKSAQPTRYSQEKWI